MVFFAQGFTRCVLARWKDGCHLRENIESFVHTCFMRKHGNEETTRRHFIPAIYQLLVLFIFSF